jgi:hypothetical protein
LVSRRGKREGTPQDLESAELNDIKTRYSIARNWAGASRGRESDVEARQTIAINHSERAKLRRRRNAAGISSEFIPMRPLRMKDFPAFFLKS